MRPSPAFDPSSGRPRKQSIDLPSGPSNTTTFFLARESDLNRQPATFSSSPNPSPVRSLKETLEEADIEPRLSPGKAVRQNGRSGSRRRSTIRPKSIDELRQEASRQPSGLLSPSGPSSLFTSFTPSLEPSLPGSPKSISSRSMPKSDDELTQDEGSSQAIESDDEDLEEVVASGVTSMQDSAPQLIMPSIRMPSRRPFTERGKRLGRFKIMVVGPKGSGKTSLIKSIVQLCEDIVHVDPLHTSLVSKPTVQDRKTTNHFHETYASTKAYPTWWSEMDESRVLKRRKSMGDSVLERNLCFVDTSGIKTPSSAAHYIEQQLLKTINSANQASSELTGLLSGKGGTQVDVVLYLVTHATLSDDREHIQHLSRISNVVPLISKSDLLTTEQVLTIKSEIGGESCIPHILTNFGVHIEEESTCKAPYTVSAVNGPDFDNMDASLLMSSEYIQPLLPSELHLLLDHIFRPDNVAYLRHVAAKKLITWYHSGSLLTRTPSPSQRSLNQSVMSSHRQVSISGALIPFHSEPSLNASNSFTLAKVADHTNREERLAQVRLSKWASDLQLSLQRERERYELLARGERANWLIERMGEEIRDGQLLPITSFQSTVHASEKGNIFRADGVTYQIHDPLGLLKWQDIIRSQTWLALQVVGSFGVVGGLALWITKTWGIGTSFHQWAQEWGIWHE